MTCFAHVLVAGGAGFIGSHITDRLLDQDMEVTVLDNLHSGLLDNIKQNNGKREFHFVNGDVRNFRLIKRLVKDVDAVFNEAAIVSVPRSVEDPLLANEVNVGGSLNLLKASADLGVKRFIQASSASVYGNTEKLPLCEDATPSPMSPYAVTEMAVEAYARTFYLTYGIETICLRYFNVYGPRQTFNLYSGATTIFLSQLMQDQKPVIFGDGNQTRDFVHVDDVVKGNMLALDSKNGVGEVFNIGTGEPHTINELVCVLQRTLRKQHLKPIHQDPRKADIYNSYASIEKSRRVLGYRPEFSFESGIARLARWYQMQNRSK